MERDYSILSKSNWFATDIQSFYGCSKSTADYIKKKTEEKFGCILADEQKEQRAVRADDVIAVMGGQSRMNEIQILLEIKRLEKLGER